MRSVGVVHGAKRVRRYHRAGLYLADRPRRAAHVQVHFADAEGGDSEPGAGLETDLGGLVKASVNDGSDALSNSGEGAGQVGGQSAGTESAGTESAGTESAGTESAGTESAGTESAGTESAAAKAGGAEIRGAETRGAETGAARTRPATEPAVGEAELGTTTAPPDPPAGVSPGPRAAIGGRGRRVAGFFGTAHGLFLVIGTVFLGIFVFMVPPGYGLDEQTHFFRMYQISEGKLFPSFDADRQQYLAEVPKPVYDLLQQGWFDSNTVRRDLPFFHRKDLPDPAPYAILESQSIDPDDLVVTDITQTLPNFPIVYFASSAGLALARALGADVGGMVMAAKICAALMYLGLAFLAVWFARRLRFRWLVLTAALLPAAIFQSAVISADTFANGMSLLFLSIAITTIVERKPVGRGTLILLAVVSAGVVMSKPTYALLVLLVAVLPVEVFSSRSRGRLYKAGVLIGALLLIVLTLYIANKGTLAINSQRPEDAASINAVGQIKDLLGNPLHLIVVLGATIVIYSESWVQGVVGLFGYNTIPVPAPFVFLTVVALTLAAFHAERLRRCPGLGGFHRRLPGFVGNHHDLLPDLQRDRRRDRQRNSRDAISSLVVAVALGAASLVPARLVMRQVTARLLFTSLSAFTLRWQPPPTRSPCTDCLVLNCPSY